ncbi:MAG: serine/threonine protein kinase [Myxococcales bacterium]|nr:serine/threonine protein kinase [Myxococcales bacterium]
MSYAQAQPAAPIAFGKRYWLLRPLATGGMAEIYLARQNAMAGFDKEVVIKRLKPELAADPRIVEMFLDEARIGAVLNHPNIVHVYDVDEEGGVPYIAMEYIVGEELNELCRRGLGFGRFLPLEHAVELIRQAAAGMGYFHAKRGSEGSAFAGQGLEIVHCDISPTNLLVTEDGFLKLIDFGIARAKDQRPREEGMIPGKLSYMSPEQATRGVVDYRSDIFSLGVVLYEITVGRRLFKGPAHEVVRRLTAGEIEAPTFIKRDFPGQLEGIIMRALERHPESRYPSAYDLADDLEGFLRDARLHSGPVRIARYLDELAEAAGGQRRPELIAESDLAKIDEELDFDGQMFDGYQAAPDEPKSEWDEYQEADAEVAAALGLELEQLRLMRTPVPHRSEDGELSLPLPAPRDSTPGPSSWGAPPEPGEITAPKPRIDLATLTAEPIAGPIAEAPPVAEPPPVEPPAAPLAVVPPTAPIAAAPPRNLTPVLVLGVSAGIALGILMSRLL